MPTPKRSQRFLLGWRALNARTSVEGVSRIHHAGGSVAQSAEVYHRPASRHPPRSIRSEPAQTRPEAEDHIVTASAFGRAAAGSTLRRKWPCAECSDKSLIRQATA